ncbi:MAG: glycoside hydrolase family 2 TIM barrel-domain containing protein [Planctomycetota bacterium]
MLAVILMSSVPTLAACSTHQEVKAGSSPSTQSAKASKAEVRRTEDGWQLFLDGAPFQIKGAGLEFGSMEALARHGANSLRTWRTDNGRRSGKAVLDEAQARGLKVTMGIEVGRERMGFDYDDDAAVADQLARIRREVLEFKDHPALIIWGIGNELNHHAENPRVWDAVNDISLMIHELDPYHLTTTSLSGMDPETVRLVKERAPDIDLLSVQMYAEIAALPERIAVSGWDGPILVTEWGATGYWEVGQTPWGAPLENNSSRKADFYLSRFRRSIESQREQVVGSYVFLWGQKQERTPTWFGMFTADGRETEAVDVMHFIWTGAWPQNRSPRVESLRLDGRAASEGVKLSAGQSYEAVFEVVDPDGDPLTIRWEIMRESTSTKTGGDDEAIPESIEGLIVQKEPGRITLRAPMERGAYRLFAYGDDTAKHTAHANVPFLVE